MKKNLILFCAVFFMFMLLFINVKADAIAINLNGSSLIKDTYVSNYSPFSYYSGTGDLKVFDKWSTGNEVRRSYLKFSLDGIPQTSTINSALLTLYNGAQDGSGYNIDIHHLYSNVTWGDSTINWYLQPCGLGFDNASACNLTATNKSIVASPTTIWDVTPIVSVEVLGRKNASIAIKMDDETTTTNAVIFRSTEYGTSTRPNLFVNYTLGQANGTSCGYVNSDLNLSSNISHLYGDCLIVNSSNITINCGGYYIVTSSGSGINSPQINSQTYFDNITIKNCNIIISGGDNGIRIASSHNSNIINNSIITSGNFDYAFKILGGSNNTIFNNNITTMGTSGYGVEITSSSLNNNFSNNNITTTGATGYGIYFSSSASNNNTFNNNRISTNSSGGHAPAIFIAFASGNNFTNTNITTGGGYDYGIYFYTNAHNNLFINTNISTIGTTAPSIFFYNSYDNIIKDSIFNSKNFADVEVLGTGINNLTNCTFNESDTMFYSGATGSINVFRYLDVYTNDTNGNVISSVNVSAFDVNSNLDNWSLTDGSGLTPRLTLREYMQNITNKYYDTNYTINASKSNYNTATKQLNLTTNFIDTNKIFLTLTAPIITLPLYTNATLKKNTDSLTFNVSVTDAGSNPAYCSINVNGNANQTVAVTSGWCNGTYSLSGLTDGNKTINAYANDSAGNIRLNDSYVVLMDTTAPLVSFVSPTPNNETITTRNLEINVSDYDLHPANVILNWNGTNETHAYTSNYTLITKNNLPNGNYTFYAYATDGAGNINITGARWVYVNSTAPVIDLVSPTNNKYENTLLKNFTCDLTASGINQISNVTFYWNFSGTWQANGTITGINQVNYLAGFYRNVSDKSITWNCLAVDNESNSAFSTANYTYTIDTIKPSVSINPNTDYNTILTSRDYALVNFTISDANLYEVLLDWNNRNQSFIDISGDFYSVNKTNLVDGNYTFSVFAEDYANNTNGSTYWVFIDNNGPVIAISSPTAGQTISNANYPPWLVSPTFTITDEFPILSCSYNVTDLTGTPIVANTVFGCSNTSVTFPINSAGSYYFNIAANGTNHNSTASRLFLMSYNSNPTGGPTGSTPTANLTCQCGNGVCEASCGESALTCQADCGQTRDIESLIRDNWKILILIAGITVAAIFLLRKRKR